MNSQIERALKHRPRPPTTVVVLLVVAAITLANLSSEPVTGDLIMRIANKPERAYGWPLTWYWRTAVTVPSGILNWSGAPRPALQWPVARYVAIRLMANFAIWSTLVAGTAAVCQRLLHKFPNRPNWRPRVTTLILLLLIAAPIALANLTFDMSWSSAYPNGPGAIAKASFGWPLAWNWYVIAPFDNVYGWDFSAARMAGNIAIWLGMLVLAGVLLEWLLRRFRPRLRFSVRTMLVAIGLIAILCAWCVANWKRANEQDALAASIGNGSIWVKRSGPRWLPDRFRRHIVGAAIGVGRTTWSDAEEAELGANNHQNESPNDENTSTSDEQRREIIAANDKDRCDKELLRQLARLPELRFMTIECGALTRAVADALAELRRIRALHLGVRLPRPDRPANLAWLPKLGQLEQLTLRGVGSGDLSRLAGLTRLKSLTLDFTDCNESETEKRLAAIGMLRQLRRVRLEGFPADQVARLRALSNVKSLTLDFDPLNDGPFDVDSQRVHECFVALGRLTQLEQLDLQEVERLPIGAEDIACLRGLTNLKSLRIHLSSIDDSEPQAYLAAIAKITQLRRLWLEGDLVSGGVAQLSPLELLEDLTSDVNMATPAALKSLPTLKRLRAVHIARLNGYPHSTTKKTEEVRRTLAALQRSHPEIIVDADDNTRWMEAQKEDFPWWGFEYFYAERTDLDRWLGLSAIMGP